MRPKVSFLHEATAVIEESSTSPAHSEPADGKETHLSTEHDSVISCYRPKCNAILGTPLMAAATQRMKCGGGYRFIFPGHWTLSWLFVFFPSRLTLLSGSAKPKATHDASSPPGPPNLTPGLGLHNPHLPERSHTCQCLQTSVFAFPVPCLAADRIPNGGTSDSKGHISSTPPSLKSLKRKTDLLQITFWILGSDILSLQRLEPIVGNAPISYPSIIDDYGLKGQSIYTAFFDRNDMETFVCWTCSHTVEGDLEVAIAHQRAVHFLHKPYQCHALNGKW